MSERRYKHPQVVLRLSDELKVNIVELAEVSGHSANAEMVTATDAWVEKNNHIQDNDLSAVAERLIALEAEVKMLKSIYNRERK